MDFNMLHAFQNWMLGLAKNMEEDVMFPLFNMYGLIKTKEKLQVWGSIKEKEG